MNAELALSDTFQKLGIALGLGLIVGMQRERTDSRLAGIRTFPLITMLGTVSGLLAQTYGGWVVVAGWVSLGALVIIGNLGRSQESKDPGITTEAAVLLMFGLGAYLVPGHALVAAALAGTIAILLHLKPEMHAFARAIGDKDFKAIMQFVLISLVILPVLPNEDYGPYKFFNPYKTWLLVVFIVGLRLAGYIAYRFLGARTGSLLNGVLGGLVSSTATTVSYARQEREEPQTGAMAALVIMIASAVVFIRVLVIIAIVAPMLFAGMAGPLGGLLAASALITAGLWLRTPKETVSTAEQSNPSELKPALIFALLFTLVRFGVAVAQDRFGTQGLYVVSILSGLTDMDAITLSTLEMAKRNDVGLTLAWRMLIVAALANVVFKGATVAVMGSRKLLLRIAVPFGALIVAGLLIIALWPTPAPAAPKPAPAANTAPGPGVDSPEGSSR